MVSLSSTEVEYIDITGASGQAMWMWKFIKDIGERKFGSTTLLYDNQSTIQFAKNLVHHSRSKHFDMKYQFIRDMVEKKVK